MPFIVEQRSTPLAVVDFAGEWLVMSDTSPPAAAPAQSNMSLVSVSFVSRSAGRLKRAWHPKPPFDRRGAKRSWCRKLDSESLAIGLAIDVLVGARGGRSPSLQAFGLVGMSGGRLLGA